MDACCGDIFLTQKCGDKVGLPFGFHKHHGALSSCMEMETSFFFLLNWNKRLEEGKLLQQNPPIQPQSLVITLTCLRI